MYIFVERHNDGSWWWHSYMGYAQSEEEAEEIFSRFFWYDIKRPHKILAVENHFPESGKDTSWFSRDLKHFFEHYTLKEHTI